NLEPLEQIFHRPLGEQHRLRRIPTPADARLGRLLLLDAIVRHGESPRAQDFLFLPRSSTTFAGGSVPMSLRRPSCCPIDRTLLVKMYNVSPAGRFCMISVKKTGMK